MIVRKPSFNYKRGFFIEINIFGALFAIGFFVLKKHNNSPLSCINIL